MPADFNQPALPGEYQITLEQVRENQTATLTHDRTAKNLPTGTTFWNPATSKFQQLDHQKIWRDITPAEATNANTLNGEEAAFYQNADNLTAGEIHLDRMPAGFNPPAGMQGNFTVVPNTDMRGLLQAAEQIIAPSPTLPIENDSTHNVPAFILQGSATYVVWFSYLDILSGVDSVPMGLYDPTTDTNLIRISIVHNTGSGDTDWAGHGFQAMFQTGNSESVKAIPFVSVRQTSPAAAAAAAAFLVQRLA